MCLPKKSMNPVSKNHSDCIMLKDLLKVKKALQLFDVNKKQSKIWSRKNLGLRRLDNSLGFQVIS